jgi:hypothetical protein
LSTLLTDAEIATLIRETKPLQPGYLNSLQLEPKQGHKVRELDLKLRAKAGLSLD